MTPIAKSKKPETKKPCPCEEETKADPGKFVTIENSELLDMKMKLQRLEYYNNRNQVDAEIAYHVQIERNRHSGDWFNGLLYGLAAGVWLCVLLLEFKKGNANRRRPFGFAIFEGDGPGATASPAGSAVR